MRKLLLPLLLLSSATLGQTNAPPLLNAKGTTLPSSCTIGKLFFKTNATAGNNIYACGAANIWTQVVGVPAASGVTTFNTRSGAVTLTGGDVSGAGGVLADGTIPVVLTRNPLPGDYTLAKSGIVFKNVAGDEVFRIWGTDPDVVNDFNSQNLYIGLLAGEEATTNNTDSAYMNVGVGSYVMRYITTGIANAGFGHAALNMVSTGVGNSAFGHKAGVALTTGGYNVAVGEYALSGTATGTGNVAIGVDAGLFLADGNTEATEVENSILIGMETRVKANSQTNQIAIGYNVVGAGSNTAVIGNADVTDVYLGSEAAAATVHAADFIVGSTSIKPIRCVSASASGGLTIGVSNKVTATCTGATNGMVASCSPTTYPGDGVIWNCYVSAADTVTVVETGLAVVTPTATTFQVSVTP